MMTTAPSAPLAAPRIANAIDLSFAVTADGPLPADHAFPLYAAVTTRLPDLHGADGYGLHPIRGRQIGNRLVEPQAWSRLVVRTAAERIAEFLPLSGETLRVGPAALSVGVPTVEPLRPSPALRSRLVTIKLREALSPESFAAGVRRQLDALDVSPSATATVGRQRTVRIKDREILGFEVVLEGLSAEDSLLIQQAGIGGRRVLGCGVFTPLGGTGK